MHDVDDVVVAIGYADTNIVVVVDNIARVVANVNGRWANKMRVAYSLCWIEPLIYNTVCDLCKFSGGNK